jgi:DNA-binding transcriptional MerR regulator
MHIKDLAAATDTPADTIRYYEKAGLLPAGARGDNNYRHFGTQHVARLRFIRHCRLLDMSLDEIRQLLPMLDDPTLSCDKAAEVIHAHLQHVQARLKQLRATQSHLRHLLGQCKSTTTASGCGLLQALGQSPGNAQFKWDEAADHLH